MNQKSPSLKSKILNPVLVLLLVLVGCAPTTMSGEPLAVANRLYEAGEFGAAAAAYQALVDAEATADAPFRNDVPFRNGVVYYNLGNAYFKLGDVGRAVLNYRRAQRLLPRDEDVAANLRLARAQTQDRLEVEDGNGLARWVERLLTEWLTLDEAATVALILWVLVCALVILALLRPRYRQVLRYAIITVAVVLALSVLSVGLRVWDARRAPAVIVANNVEIRSGPGTDYLTEFTLHAGAEVRVIEARDEWLRIALPGDLQGWGPVDAVVMVLER